MHFVISQLFAWIFFIYFWWTLIHQIWLGLLRNFFMTAHDFLRHFVMYPGFYGDISVFSMLLWFFFFGIKINEVFLLYRDFFKIYIFLWTFFLEFCRSFRSLLLEVFLEFSLGFSGSFHVVSDFVETSPDVCDLLGSFQGFSFFGHVSYICPSFCVSFKSFCDYTFHEHEMVYLLWSEPKKL